MASPIIRENGIGGTSGADLVSLAPLYTSGAVHYVSSTTGDNSYAGTDRVRPVATLAQAHTNASAGDLIVCLSGHAETLTAAQTFDKAQVCVFGEGAEANAPRFTRFGDVNMFDVTAAGVRFFNIYFPASITTTTAKSRMRFAGAGNQCIGCYFDCSTLDDGPSGVETITGAGNIRVANTRFTSTASAASDQPDSAMKVTNALTHLDLDTVVFDGGTSGWTNPYAFNGAAAITGLFAIRVDLLAGSDITLATGTTGYIQRRNKSGSAIIVWAA